MATSSYDSAFSFEFRTINVPAGVTNALYFGMTACLIQSHVKANGVSNLVLLAAGTNGSTMAAATLAAHFVAGNYYAMGSSQYFDLEGPGQFYLAAIGATGTASIMRSYSQNSQG